MIDKDGVEITAFDEQDASATIPTHVNDLVNDGLFASIIPNPSHNTAQLRVVLPGATTVDVRVTDIAGKLVWKHSDRREAGESSIELPSVVAPGMYMVTVANGSEPATQQLKWIKQ
ncbi:T9SS type A sorting domain-containing protein [Polluticoccus soli]|uniref:T9SS type A sorting domain-containing protein n=1 Tax=Polluticoccus soli TaxID=3034150 RepID=UPI0023E2C5B9|nr:T9SS type A sorting domain-containing protein [Flavipsychrobacter sp. JY13-12]